MFLSISNTAMNNNNDRCVWLMRSGASANTYCNLPAENLLCRKHTRAAGAQRALNEWANRPIGQTSEERETNLRLFQELQRTQKAPFPCANTLVSSVPSCADSVAQPFVPCSHYTQKVNGSPSDLLVLLKKEVIFDFYEKFIFAPEMIHYLPVPQTAQFIEFIIAKYDVQELLPFFYSTNIFQYLLEEAIDLCLDIVISSGGHNERTAHKLSVIARHKSVDISTIIRWIEKYEKRYPLFITEVMFFSKISHEKLLTLTNFFHPEEMYNLLLLGMKVRRTQFFDALNDPAVLGISDIASLCADYL
jgi:hypothetical protein